MGSVIQNIMNYGFICTCQKESGIKSNKLPLSLLIAAFQKLSLYLFLLIFYTLFKRTEVAEFCHVYVNPALFLFRVTSLVTQCSHFTRSKVSVQQHHGLLSKELQKAGLVGSTAAEEAGRSKQGSFANRRCFYLRMSEWSREVCRIKRRLFL